MDLILEFLIANKDWLGPAAAALVSAAIAYFTALFRTRTSRLTDLIDGKNVYDDNDEVFIPLDAKPGTLIPLSQLSVVKKGKNADVKKS